MKCPHCGKEINPAAMLGGKGGKASARSMTKQQRQARGRKAIAARWAKVREQKKSLA